MNPSLLQKTVSELLAPGKGLLAADESTTNIAKKFAPIGLPSTPDTHQAYRDMLFTAPGMEEFISGVILYDETIRQNALSGVPFPKLLADKGVVPGIKVDLGLSPMTTSPNEQTTKGLEGLRERLVEYRELGARFAKWRALITILPAQAGEPATPTDENIRRNAQDLAHYARVCQEADIVPIVEPEVFMNGTHGSAECERVLTKVLLAVFSALRAAQVDISGILLKTSMVTPGSTAKERMEASHVAEATLRVFKTTFPHGLRGEAFLSGGQSELEATRNLNEIVRRGPHPWVLTFSYGRALQDSALHAWGGSAKNVEAGQKAFLHRARMNSLAARGEWEEALER